MRFYTLSKLFLTLLVLTGTGYLTYELAFDGASYDYQTRWEVRNEPKTTFTYYFFWYDNNSGGDAALTTHIYNHPTNFGIKNSTLINITTTIAANSVQTYNISALNPDCHDFDMFQVKYNSTFDNLTVYGLTEADYAKFQTDPMNYQLSITRYEFRNGSFGYLRIPYRRTNVKYVVVHNQQASTVQYSIIGNIFNDTLSHHPDPTKFEGDFSYKNVMWHKYEIENIMHAGIDVFLPIYWGAWSGEFNTIGMEKMVDALELLEAEYGLDAIPKVGLFMDTTGFLVACGSPPDLTTADGKALFSTFVNEFFAYIPEKYLFKVNGADLVWMYGSNFIAKYNDSTFDNAQEMYKQKFGENRKLAFVGVDFTEHARRSQLGAYTWGVSLNGARLNSKGIAIGSIGPGFYAEGAYRCGCQFDLGIREQKREGGQYYIDSFRQVMQGSQWIVIEVWNEYHEGNDISYTLEYQDLYINLTRQLITEFHTTPFIDWRDNDSYIIATIGALGCLIFVVFMDKNRAKKPELP